MDLIRELQYPLFTRGASKVTGKGRMRLAAVQEPVTAGDIVVSPGDLIVADDSSVWVISQSPREVKEFQVSDLKGQNYFF